MPLDVTRLTRPTAPDLAMERLLFGDGCRSVAGLDEVGRGAWAGPLVVGVVVVERGTRPPPGPTRDSKQLTARARCAVAPALRSWCTAWALGEASAKEIDDVGMSVALRLAARRALDLLVVLPDALILDGTVDFVSPPTEQNDSRARSPHGRPRDEIPRVQTVARGDSISATVAAASILAKVSRDQHMTDLAGDFPDYGFERHKGYGTREHESAITRGGLTAQHRRSWQYVERLCPDERGSAGPRR